MNHLAERNRKGTITDASGERFSGIKGRQLDQSHSSESTPLVAIG